MLLCVSLHVAQPRVRLAQDRHVERGLFADHHVQDSPCVQDSPGTTSNTLIAAAWAYLTATDPLTASFKETNMALSWACSGLGPEHLRGVMSLAKVLVLTYGNNGGRRQRFSAEILEQAANISC